ncbi:Asp-tRNA(Asn)/Glu-tRNA(Gln) amidotransferase subunit GatC [Leucothrix pacifica]|uniref:Aspartyl/glutamyl-tRNA(Asn/Gln) amidotransferase subunit C n=1 Tax=Leucothrix pacifica TaxID=1247513 RepID=A0A317C238_9GAMM|nr:Asp-tRNA(Asn)/Glu-tRNA(Gln) amidotransferase subunit GatC [Leucothrix pacifica]PWQ92251.1 Asp-tRNA(Asn)/Glu-tRNA(Gln) amidotransferase GatCAB subunit C [Leucothrix pacifica]
MSLTASDVKKISHLARLAIDEADIEPYANNLSNILGLVEQMDAADVADIEPMANPQDATQRLRDDIVTEVNQREKFQAIAPNTEAGLYLVPKVLE